MLTNPNKATVTPEMQAIYNILRTMVAPFQLSLGEVATLEQKLAYNELATKYNALVPADKQGSTKVLFSV